MNKNRQLQAMLLPREQHARNSSTLSQAALASNHYTSLLCGMEMADREELLRLGNQPRELQPEPRHLGALFEGKGRLPIQRGFCQVVLEFNGKDFAANAPFVWSRD